jgi:hypothetical protein
VPTYAVVTKAPAEAVSAAIRAGRTGGYLVAEPTGTAVLFDPPSGLLVTARKLVRPARVLVSGTGVAAWLLYADPGTAAARLVTPDRTRPRSLRWTADWQPPADPARYIAYRKTWDADCAELARMYGEPDRGPLLAAVRNDPVPGRPPVPLSDLLRMVCRAFDLPEITVGRSLLDAREPGVYGATRVDPATRDGRLTRRAG